MCSAAFEVGCACISTALRCAASVCCTVGSAVHSAATCCKASCTALAPFDFETVLQSHREHPQELNITQRPRKSPQFWCDMAQPHTGLQQVQGPLLHALRSSQQYIVQLDDGSTSNCLLEGRKLQCCCHGADNCLCCCDLTAQCIIVSYVGHGVEALGLATALHGSVPCHTKLGTPVRPFAAACSAVRRHAGCR